MSASAWVNGKSNLVLVVFWGNLMEKYMTLYDLTLPNQTLLNFPGKVRSYEVIYFSITSIF
jgi:hypothetical protein